MSIESLNPEERKDRFYLGDEKYKLATDFLNEALKRFDMVDDKIEVRSPDYEGLVDLPASATRFFPDGIVSSYFYEKDPNVCFIKAILGNNVISMKYEENIKNSTQQE